VSGPVLSAAARPAGFLLLLALVAFTPGAQAKDVTVHAGTEDGRLYFRPSEIRVAEGERVAFTLVNDDPSTPHDWALLSFGGRDVEVYVKGGESRTVTFTANETGTFRIVCQVVGHKQQGMTGTLVVEPKSLLPLPSALPVAAFAAAGLLLRRGPRRRRRP
jgi:plastocyanin